MGQLDPGPTRAYPSIPHVGDDLASHKRAIEAIVEAIRIHERRTKNIDDSFVRVRDLQDLEITTVEYQITSPAPIDGGDIIAGTVTSTQLGDSSVTVTELADGAVTLTKFDTGIEPVSIVTSLPTLPDTNYPDGAVVVLTTDGLLYRNNSGTWTKVVNTTDIDGTINLASQVSGTLTAAFAEAGLINSNVTINADGTLTGAGGGQASLNSLPGTIQLASYAATQRPVIIVGTLPTLPDSDYPSGSTVVLTTDGKLYRNNAGTWTAAVPTADLSGTIDLASQVSGTLTAAFAEAGLINSNVTINADGTLSGAGGGQASLNSLPGTIQLASYAATQRPVIIVGTLPTLPDSNYPSGAVVVLTTDGKLYRNNAGTWTAAVPTADLSGTIDLGTQISGTLTAAFAEAGLINSNVTINADGTLSGAGAGQANLGSLPGTISLSTQVSGTLTSAFAEAGLINTNVTINADGTLTGAGGGQANLASLPGQIVAGQIAANTITAGQIAALTITAAEIAASTITGAKIAADTITAGNIAALTITAAEIAASTITGAKIAANTIAAGNIVAGTITSTEIATDTITAGNIAAGAISTSELAADAVTASKLAIVSTSSALNVDPYVSDATAWVNTAGGNWEIASVTDGKVGTSVIRSTGNPGNSGFVEAAKAPIDPNKTYRLHAWVRRKSGDRRVYLTAAFKDGTGATVTTPITGWTGSGTYNYWGLSSADTTVLPADSVWREYTFTFGPNETASAPTGAVTLQIGGILNYTGGTTDGIVEVQDLRVEEVLPGTLIQDGVITTDKIAANTITAANIAALTITAAEIAANTITAAKIAANTITASEIAAGTITATEIATDTITAANIAAGAISTSELAADAVTASKLAIVSTSGALNTDPYTSDATAWSTVSGSNWEVASVTDGKVGTSVIRSNGSTGNAGFLDINYIPIDAAKTYRLRAWVRRKSGDRKVYLSAAFRNSSDAVVTSPTTGWGAFSGSPYNFWGLADAGTATLPADSVWREYTLTFGPNETAGAPTGAVSVQLGAYLNYTGGTTDGIVEVQDLRIEEVLPGTLIQDGVISTDKIAANAVTAAKIAALTITAAEIAAGTITGAKIAATTITASNIAAGTITANEIAGNTITAGQIAAGAIDTDELAANAVTAAKLAASITYTGTLIIGTNGYIRGGQTAYNTGSGFFLGYSGAAYKFSIGNGGTNSLTWDGTTLTVVGSITASALASSITTTGSLIISTGGHIRGGQTAYNTGSGFFLGYDTSTYKFSIGDGSSNSLTWDGTTLTVKGQLAVGTLTQSTSQFYLSADTQRTEANNDTGADNFIEYKKFQVGADGTIYMRWEDSRATYAGTLVNNGKVRWKKNGAVQNTQTVTNTTYTQRSFSGTVSAGDFVTVEISGGTNNDGGEWFGFGISIRNARIGAILTLTADGSVITD